MMNSCTALWPCLFCLCIGRLQLMCYKYLWDGLATGTFPIEYFFKHFKLNPQYILSEDVKQYAASLGLNTKVPKLLSCNLYSVTLFWQGIWPIYQCISIWITFSRSPILEIFIEINIFYANFWSSLSRSHASQVRNSWFHAQKKKGGWC